MAGLEVSQPQSQKQKFVAKEGTTYQEVCQKGTNAQKLSFIIFDFNNNDRLEGNEVKSFNRDKVTLKNDVLTHYYTAGDSDFVDTFEFPEITKINQLDRQLKKYGVKVDLYDLYSINNVKVVDNSKDGKMLVIDAED